MSDAARRSSKPGRLAAGVAARVQDVVARLAKPPSADPQTVSRGRLRLVIGVFALIFAVIAGKTAYLAAGADGSAGRRGTPSDAMSSVRPDILDRNGEILATDVKTASLFAEPRRIIDVDEALELLSAVLPDLDMAETRERLSSKKGFAWLRREITAQQQAQIHRLGIPGIGFLRENKRVYPAGAVAGHVLGHVNIDNQGIAGIERWVDSSGLAFLHQIGLATDRAQNPVQLAVDLRVQHAMRDELMQSKTKFKAKAASGAILDVNSGEVIAMVSLPDYDPNKPASSKDDASINRLTTGVYEMGSTFKALTLAMALDSGKISLNSTWDARAPLRYGRFSIDDFHATRRILSTPEVFTHSSNIGTARMALAIGVDGHKAFLKKMGQLERLRTELPESAEPIVPKRWGELNTVTIAFGHGLSVAPMQAAAAVCALVNGGALIPPTFLKRSAAEARKLGVQVIKPETSDKMRYLMRLNAEVGSATKAEVKGYYVGGKTGTAEKVINGRYAKNKVMAAFMAILPADAPKYLVLVMLDEPQGLPETHGFATSGWNAAPTTGKIIARVAPMLGLEKREDLPPAEALLKGGPRITAARSGIGPQ
ncbi:peptidoglycan D,D-transpeptidase FtsI family protein [Blastochloris viridis]|uniref:Cell division protein FtsI n=1 Tax=Blastochloris viridis TaxID=1079 RepID=A0A0H5BP03_BLAVI|nr:penicillin-binding protein 2 [Blastochloris viridis]ALK08197.1 Peptidoglycan synthase FtsI [Blastochloris viridis]BAR98538.1 cell division protein FtsI [Blastochloris viridis]CUU44119.1 Penicillin-binding protein 2 [Blastochloris viridis]